MIIMELPCPKLLMCFSFLGFYIGKAIFLLFIGTLMFGFVWYEIMLAIALFIASILYFIMAFMCKDNLITEDQNGNKYDKDGSPIAVGEGASNPPANQPA